MGEQEFWNGKERFFSDIINRVNDLLSDAYLLITNRNSHVTMIPEKTAAFFEMQAGYVKDFYQILLDHVHPDDRPEYLQAMEKRFLGQKLSDELYIRLKNKDHYDMFGFFMSVVKEDGNEYLLHILVNQNVIPEIDALTDLYGQKKFEKDVEGYIRTGRKVAVLEVEIDHMADINILYGANYTDRLQREIAHHFIYMMDENKAVYHMNNSNCAFILRDADRVDAGIFLEEVRKNLEKNITLNGRHFELKLYAAGLMLENYSGETMTVQSKLEYTLEKARSARNHKLVFFNDIVKTNGGVNLDFMKIIHQSVLGGCDGFYVEYQPIVTSEGGKIAGAEALVRWKKEPYGAVPPGLFIDWIEDNPCMYDLGNYVLAEALKNSAEFIKINPDFFINVNVSAKQLEQKSFRDVVLSLLKENDYPPNHLCLEITERCRQLPIDVINEEVCFLQQYGIHFAMDDYGTGNASSSIVLGVPMNEIKIDMSFIKGILNNEKHGQKHPAAGDRRAGHGRRRDPALRQAPRRAHHAATRLHHQLRHHRQDTHRQPGLRGCRRPGPRALHQLDRAHAAGRPRHRITLALAGGHVVVRPQDHGPHVRRRMPAHPDRTRSGAGHPRDPARRAHGLPRPSQPLRTGVAAAPPGTRRGQMHLLLDARPRRGARALRRHSAHRHPRTALHVGGRHGGERPYRTAFRRRGHLVRPCDADHPARKKIEYPIFFRQFFVKLTFLFTFAPLKSPFRGYAIVVLAHSSIG